MQHKANLKTIVNIHAIKFTLDAINRESVELAYELEVAREGVLHQ